MHNDEDELDSILQLDLLCTMNCVRLGDRAGLTVVTIEIGEMGGGGAALVGDNGDRGKFGPSLTDSIL